MRLIFCLPVLALAACTASPPKSLSCSAENAVYKLRGEPGAELRLVKTPHPVNAFSDLAARVDFQGRTDWFAFVSSNGYSRDYLTSTEDPIEAARREAADEPSPEAPETVEAEANEIVAFDAGFKVVDGAIQAGQPAPAHLLATGIGLTLWYSEPRRELPKALWDLSACSETAGAQ